MNNYKVSLYCWGNTANGEFGFGGIDEQMITTPRKQKCLDINKQYLKMKQVAAGRNHTLLLLTTNSVVKGKEDNNTSISVVTRIYSCGSNDRQQLGRTGTWRRFQVIEELNKHVAVQIACGFNHSLVLTEAGQVFAFGCNLFGQLGVIIENDDCILKPSLVKKLAHEFVVQIACGGNHSIALTNKGSLYAWGSNAFGQIGDGMKGNCVYVPTLVEHLHGVPIRCISAGGSHTCAVSYLNNLYVWGKNESGQLGLNDTRNRLKPTLQPSLSNCVCYVSCGEDHSAAITKDGGLFTWGAGTYGQLGHGKQADEMFPRRVFELMGLEVTQVSCGRCHTLAVIGSKGRLYSFGLNGSGQLGTGLSRGTELTPRKVDGPWVEMEAKEVAIRARSGPIIKVDDADVENVDNEGEWKEINENNSDSELMVVDEVLSRSTSPSPPSASSPTKGDEEIVPIVEEPDDSSQHQRVHNSSSVEIDEYNSDPDSDCENERPISNHFVSSIGGIIPGSKPRVNHIKLLTVFASKGDQSYALTTRLDEELPIIDFRNVITRNLTLFDNAILESMLVIDQDEQIPDEMLDYIETTFGSVSCWNASYVSDLVEDSSISSPRIDWESAYYGFNCLRKCVNERLSELALNVIKEQLFPCLPKACGDNGINEEILRVYLLIPLFHFFYADIKNEKQITEILSPFSRAVIKLNDNAKKSLETWWSTTDKEYFGSLIKIYKNAIVFTLKCLSDDKQKEENNEPINLPRNSTASINLKLCLDFLRLLNNVNQKTNKISYKDFYIKELHDCVDIKMDYIYWLGSKCKTGNVRHDFYFCDYPFVFDGGAKTIVLATDSLIRQQNAAENAIYRNLVFMPFAHGSAVVTGSPYFMVNVNRNNLVQCAINQLLAKHSADDYKKPLKINFENEEAIDAGQGVKKEFFLLLMKDLLDPKYGKFTEYHETNSIWFNAAETDPNELQIYELIGIVCALAIYNQVIIYLPFPLPLYKKILKKPLDLDDLSYLDPYLIRSLKEILNTSYTECEFNAVYGDLNFTISLNCYGHPQDFDLCLDGAKKQLTYSNRKEYVDLYWNFILNESVSKQFGAFNAGFTKVVETDILNLFQAEELMQLIIGQENYDWQLLEKEGTSYKEPFNVDHPTIKMFWNVFHSLSEEEKRKFLLFLTGSDRIPILGMKAINFVIQAMKVGEDHLPVAHTCFNVLDLPEKYSSEQKLRNKLLQAIEHTKGFALA
ncbi:E3 ubiquitin-protein ligase HERC4-like protein [Dinothrombium tinctorium]|uniref:E3 ubiquitin-protein ligase HERC4-like protein n=1 Tax=Dinothrombium tinctorium TaxID=1965070 RepID=A0A3S3QPY8_9ACAR|nr:E3 ubiquitin-protein ligase HERC4-like protein [Dinothrombium tinctorium]RWS12136.1 E3 ubiquitin-protein ligase HERC4-like protein [Dinothrombium tinctorium]RWS12171.1 E3 ubiquitin-protein ligase HERC4-like protein [Dinothrombium tinctorium]